MLDRPYAGWDGDSWEAHCLRLLRQKFGATLIPVPDNSGGDGGLDAYTTSGTAWQSYCCENEPLTPAQRYPLQRGKVTADLGKLKKYKTRVQELLGETKLHNWILITPNHESSDLVAHCSTKSTEVRGWDLPFVAADFWVSVQTEDDFSVEARMLQSAGLIPGDLSRPMRMPELGDDGIPFEDASGPLIETMNQKLSTIISDPERRAILRSGLLKSQIAGEDRLADFETHVPDIADELHNAIDMAKHAMLMEQAFPHDGSHRARMDSAQADVSRRLLEIVPELTKSVADVMAQAATTRWLQECSMKFIEEPEVESKL